MKQHITLDQIEELNRKGTKRYIGLQKEFKWFDAQMVWLNDNVYFLIVGQMIEFLDEYSRIPLAYVLFEASKVEIDCDEIIVHKNPYVKNLCNKLWQEVKNFLEK